MTTTLKDGSTVDDPRLGRIAAFDPRSRSWPVRSASEEPRARSYTWRLTPDYVIDQGSEGACVGFACVNELISRPAEFDPAFDEAQRLAMDVYHSAQRIDWWDGGSYPGADPVYAGTSVLHGMKILQQTGWINSFWWAFGLPDLIHGLGRRGPSILGVNWHANMYRPDPDGRIRTGGGIVGGHAILAYKIDMAWLPDAYDVKWWERTLEHADLGKSKLWLHNSWGRGYGLDGKCWISLADAGPWLDDRGEAVFALNRTVI